MGSEAFDWTLKIRIKKGLCDWERAKSQSFSIEFASSLSGSVLQLSSETEIFISAK